MRLSNPLDPVVLEDDCVRLEPLGPEHVGGLTRAGADPSIWTYLPHVRCRSTADFEQLVAEAAAAFREGRERPFAITRKEAAGSRIVGTTRLMDLRPRDRGLEIGWTFIDPAFQRSDVNTRCKLLLLGYAFDSLGMIRVQLKTDRRNRRSRRAIERLGAVREGILRSHMICPDGHVRDTVFYSVLKPEWPAVRARLEVRLRKPAGPT